MGHYGCRPDCTEKISLPLFAEATVNLIRRRPMSSVLAHSKWLLSFELLSIAQICCSLTFSCEYSSRSRRRHWILYGVFSRSAASVLYMQMCISSCEWEKKPWELWAINSTKLPKANCKCPLKLLFPCCIAVLNCYHIKLLICSSRQKQIHQMMIQLTSLAVVQLPSCLLVKLPTFVSGSTIWTHDK